MKTVHQAELVQDVSEPLLEGSRTATIAAPRRQLLWTSERADLALTMWTDDWSPHAITVDGQVLPRAGGVDYVVRLRIEGVDVARTTTDEDGCFTLDGLDRGEYEFRLEATDHEIVASRIAVLDSVPTSG